MSVFNINDYKPDTDIDLEALDERYVNVEGDTMDLLNVKTIQMYDLATISFGDSTTQTTAFNEDVVQNMVDQYNNSKATYNFNNKPLTAVKNITFTDGTMQTTAGVNSATYNFNVLVITSIIAELLI